MFICLFDIDGTLLSSGGAGKAAMEAALADEFGVRDIKHVSYSGRTDRSIMRDLLGFHDIEPSDANRQRLTAGYLQRLPAYLDKHKGKVLPGIADLLVHLAERKDVAVGLLTGNIREGAKRKLGFFEIEHHFSFGGFGDHHWERDDVAREAWAEVQSRYGQDIARERVWVIGDTPLDVQCARAIGARVVAVATGYHAVEELTSHNPDLVLSDLAHTAPFLDRLR